MALVPSPRLSGEGLDKLMRAVLDSRCLVEPQAADARAQPLAAEALEPHAPPAVSGRRIKIRYMTQANARPPTFVLFCSRPKALPESYLRYLVNSLRETFDMPGVPIRLHLRKGDNPYA